MKRTLSDVCLAIVDCEHKTAPKSDDGGYPLIRTTDIGRGRIDLSNVHRVDASAYEEWTRRAVPQPDDLVLAREAPVGNVAIITPGMEPVLGQRTVLIRPDPDVVDPQFLTYRLLADDIQHWMTGVANGATVPHLNMEDIRTLPLPELPELAVQKRIGAAVSAFDDLIENNRRRIEILEEMARLIYREWFVHFRFPGHEDAEFEDSELGVIPQGWSVVCVDDVATLIRGRSYRSADLVEQGGCPFLNLKCIDRGGGFRRDGIKRYAGRFTPDQATEPGDVVIAVTDMTQQRNVVGRAARVPLLREAFAVISLDLARVVPRKGTTPEYLYAMFRYSTFGDEVKEHANGTNVLHLNPDRIREYKFTKSPQKLVGAYTDVVAPVYDLANNLELQNEALNASRDLLLPRLVSGELDASELDLDLASAE